MTYTKGPWKVEEPSKGSRSYTINGEISDDDFGEELALLRCWENNEKQNKQQKDNAQLIAAAPELLEACKLAREFLKGWGPKATGTPYNDNNPLTEAINKAEGKV